MEVVMHQLIREEGSFGSNPGAKDIARHLYSRMLCGKVVVVAEKPTVLISTLRKQWLKFVRKVQVQRASTLDAARIQELTNLAGYMQNLRFTTQYPPDDYPGDVYLATVEQILRWPPVCRTMYVTREVELEKLHMITAWMPKGSLLVMCRLAEMGGKT